MARKSKEATLEYQRKYRQEHKAYFRQYYEEHKEKAKEYQHTYYQLTDQQKKVRHILTKEEKLQKKLAIELAYERREAAKDKLKKYGIEIEDFKKNCTVILSTKFRPEFKIENKEIFERRFNRHERNIQIQLKQLIDKNIIYIYEYNGMNRVVLSRSLYCNRCDWGDIYAMPEEVFQLLSNFDYYKHGKE